MTQTYMASPLSCKGYLNSYKSFMARIVGTVQAAIEWHGDG